jgi:hypothetical protein
MRAPRKGPDTEHERDGRTSRVRTFAQLQLAFCPPSGDLRCEIPRLGYAIRMPCIPVRNCRARSSNDIDQHAYLRVLEHTAERLINCLDQRCGATSAPWLQLTQPIGVLVCGTQSPCMSPRTAGVRLESSMNARVLARRIARAGRFFRRYKLNAHDDRGARTMQREATLPGKLRCVAGRMVTPGCFQRAPSCGT